MEDALHIATVALHRLDFIVSLNFRHIVKKRAMEIVAMVNDAEGCGGIRICEPGELA
jgi:hypothetical protein